MILAVPAAVVLLERNGDDSSAGKVDRLGELKNCLAVLIAQARPGVDGPGGFIAAVEGKLKWADDPLLPRFVVKVRLERRLRLFEVRRAAGDLEFLLFIGRLDRRGFNLDLRQCERPFE